MLIGVGEEEVGMVVDCRRSNLLPRGGVPGGGRMKMAHRLLARGEPLVPAPVMHVVWYKEALETRS